MHPTTTFVAPFGFVGWTVPSPWTKSRGCLPSSLYTFPPVAGLARDYHTLETDIVI